MSTVRPLNPPPPPSAGGPAAVTMPPASAASAAEEGDDGIHASAGDVFVAFRPQIVKEGGVHPGKVVEPATLAAVTLPSIEYPLSDTIPADKLSMLQREAVTCCLHTHRRFLKDKYRAGFFLGDGAGVGKGRQIAAVIFDNYCRNRRKHIWLSVSTDLYLDARRDFEDIGAHGIRVIDGCTELDRNTKAMGLTKSHQEGVLFLTYAAITQPSRVKQIIKWCGSNFDGCLVFDECHKAKNLFVEKSGELDVEGSKTGKAVVQLQREMPGARVLYSSATGAAEVRNMAFMERLGLWGPTSAFPTFTDFYNNISNHGLGIAEMLSIELKARGCYLARSMSYEDTSFEEIVATADSSALDVYDKAAVFFTRLRAVTNQAVDLCNCTAAKRRSVAFTMASAQQRFFKQLLLNLKMPTLLKIARESMENGKCVVIGLQSTGESGLADLVAEEQERAETSQKSNKPRVQAVIDEQGNDVIVIDDDEDDDVDLSTFKIMPEAPLLAAECSHSTAVDRSTSGTEADAAASLGPSQPTRESGPLSQTATADGGQQPRQSIFSLARQIARAFLANHFPVTKPVGLTLKRGCPRLLENPMHLCTPQCAKSPGEADENEEPCPEAAAMRDALLKELDGLELPPSLLDSLIDELGGVSNVAEMTGRRQRMTRDKHGNVNITSRAEDALFLNRVNVEEKEKFMGGEKLVAIISDAASTGISLHADRRARNQRRRVHITLELPWSGEKAIQQLGRSHRANQVVGPEYILLSAPLGGEARFASAVAKRLASLGALTRGDRRAATTQDMRHYDFDTPYGIRSLRNIQRAVAEKRLIREIPRAQVLQFAPDPQVNERVAAVASTDLGLQATLSEAWKDTGLSASDNGITVSRFLNFCMALPVAKQTVLFAYFALVLQFVVDEAKQEGKYNDGIADVSGTHLEREGDPESLPDELMCHRIVIDRGVSLESAQEMLQQQPGAAFYKSKTPLGGRWHCLLAAPKASAKNLFIITRPNTGTSPIEMDRSKLTSLYRRVEVDDIRDQWNTTYTSTERTCLHGPRCTKGPTCNVGCRKSTLYLLTGMIVASWSRLSRLLAVHGSNLPKYERTMRVVRVTLSSGERIVGLHWPVWLVKELRNSRLPPSMPNTPSQGPYVQHDLTQASRGAASMILSSPLSSSATVLSPADCAIVNGPPRLGLPTYNIPGAIPGLYVAADALAGGNIALSGNIAQQNVAAPQGPGVTTLTVKTETRRDAGKPTSSSADTSQGTVGDATESNGDEQQAKAVSSLEDIAPVSDKLLNRLRRPPRTLKTFFGAQACNTDADTTCLEGSSTSAATATVAAPQPSPPVKRRLPSTGPQRKRRRKSEQVKSKSLLTMFGKP